ncbi:putative metalloprotease CJM1_0395 family protein [Thalassotalea piscium]
MNISSTSHNVTLPLATVVNPQTDALRRENNQREVIAQPAAASHSAGEKGVASDKDRARTPGQQNAEIDFAQIQEQSEQAHQTINEDQDSQQNPESSEQQREENTDPNEDEQRLDGELDFDDQQRVAELKSRDLEVRAHEQAHSASGGATTGSPSFSFEVGPDGKKYAVEGEVSVDLSTVDGNPRATIAKMQKVYSAALAPANPSVQDTKVANAAAQKIAQAQSELAALHLDNPEKAEEIKSAFTTSETFSSDAEDNGSQQPQDFDTFVNQTLKAQEQVSPSITNETYERAQRIEHLYANINHAYEKAPISNFELTA